MSVFRHIQIILFSFLCLITQGCIHEYPDENAIDPTMVEIGVDLTLDLKWNQHATNIDLSTKASNDNLHRIIIEVRRNGSTVGKETVLLKAEEFALGNLKHKLSMKLHALEYDIAVWSDITDSKGKELHYSAGHLEDITQSSGVLIWGEDKGCGFATDILDLRKYRDARDVKVMKELSLKHPGARFELIATDIMQFLDNQR